MQRDFVAATGANLVTVRVADRFLEALSGVTDPEGRRRSSAASSSAASRVPFETRWARVDSEVELFVQGTLYPDVVESGGGSGTANIKSHHNISGLPDDLKFKLVDRCSCSRTRCARWAVSWACPRKSLRANRSRAPASASGSSGGVTAARLDTLRRADAIAREELTAAGLDNQILAVPGGAAGRHQVGRRAGQRRTWPSDRAAAGVQ